MTRDHGDKDDKDDNDPVDRSIFGIMDGIIEQVNKTKTIFTILIAMIIIPLAAFVLLVAVFDIDNAEHYYGDEEMYAEEMYAEEMYAEEMYAEEMYYEGVYEEMYDEQLLIDIVLAMVILTVVSFAIRQLIILNRWTKKYQKFKDRQRELEEKSDEDLEKE